MVVTCVSSVTGVGCMYVVHVGHHVKHGPSIGGRGGGSHCICHCVVIVMHARVVMMCGVVHSFGWGTVFLLRSALLSICD